MENSCWTCGGPHEDDLCPHRLSNMPIPALQHLNSGVGAATVSSSPEAVTEDLSRCAMEDQAIRQQVQGDIPETPAELHACSPSGAATPSLPQEPPAQAKQKKLSSLAAVFDRHAGMERLSVMVLRLTLQEVLGRPQIWMALLLAGVGAFLTMINHPYLVLMVAILGGYFYLNPGKWQKLPKKIRLKQPSGWRMCFYAIWILPSILEVSGQFGLFSLVVGAGGTLNWALLAVFTLFVAGSWPAVCRRGSTGQRGLPSRWKALLGCLKAFTALSLVCWGIIVWDLAVISAATRSFLYLLAMLLLRSVPSSTLTHAAKMGVCRAVEKASRDFTEEVTGDTVLQLALLRWLLEYWSQPADYSGTDFGSMLQQIIESLKTEINRSLLAPLEQLHRTLYETDIEKEAKPMVARTQATLVALSPPLGVARWVHVTGRLPSSMTFLLVALVQGKLALPLLPLLALEFRLVNLLMEDLASRTKDCNPSTEHNGMWVLLWGSGYEDSLCRVWDNLWYAVDECLPHSLTALRVYQTSTRSVNFCSNLLKLTELSLRIQGEGWGVGAGWALKEAVALLRNDGEKSLIKNLACDAQVICQNISTLYEEGHVAQAVSPAVSKAKHGALVAADYGKSALGYLNPWSYSYFQSDADSSNMRMLVAPEEKQGHAEQVVEEIDAQAATKDGYIMSSSCEGRAEQVIEETDVQAVTTDVNIMLSPCDEGQHSRDATAIEPASAQSHGGTAMEYLNPWSCSFFKSERKEISSMSTGKVNPDMAEENDLIQESESELEISQSGALSEPPNAITNDSKYCPPHPNSKGDEIPSSLYWNGNHSPRKQALPNINSDAMDLRNSFSSSSSDDERGPVRCERISSRSSTLSEGKLDRILQTTDQFPVRRSSLPTQLVPNSVLPKDGEHEASEPDKVILESSDSKSEETEAKQENTEMRPENRKGDCESLAAKVNKYEKEGKVTQEEAQNLLELVAQAETNPDVALHIQHQLQVLQEAHEIMEASESSYANSEANNAGKDEQSSSHILSQGLSGSVNIVKKVASYSLARSPQAYALDKIRQIYANRSNGTEQSSSNGNNQLNS